MDKERALLERLERIDGLRAADAPAGVLLGEVRSLLVAAEEWAREAPGVPERVRDAIERSEEALKAGEIRSRSLVTSR
jgi:hypothetical protein